MKCKLKFKWNKFYVRSASFCKQFIFCLDSDLRRLLMGKNTFLVRVLLEVIINKAIYSHRWWMFLKKHEPLQHSKRRIKRKSCCLLLLWTVFWITQGYSLWSLVRPAPGPASFILRWNFRKKIRLQYKRNFPSVYWSVCLLLSPIRGFPDVRKGWKIKLTRT